MRIVITGATGFIGKHLLANIGAEWECICLVRTSSDCSQLPIRSNIIIQRIAFTLPELTKSLRHADIVIHMIGQMGGYGIPLTTFEQVNCSLTQNMADACKAAHVKQFIYLSTPGVQGFGKRLCVETEPYAPRNPYEQTKVRAEEIIISTLSDSDVRYTILRPDFVYGPGDYRRIKMYKNIRDKKFILTTSGKSYLHPTYVLDVVQGIIKSVDNPAACNEIFNLSAETDITVLSYLQTMADYFHAPLIRINIGYPLSILFSTLIEKAWNFFLKKDGFVSRNKIDFLALDHSTSNQKAKERLGYKPEYDFKSGFALTMDWCQKNNLL